MRFDEKLNWLAGEREMNQREIADAIGVHKATVNRWFQGTAAPGLAPALKLARALGVTLDYLVDESQDVPPPSPSFEERKAIEYAGQLGWDVALQQLAAALANRAIYDPSLGHGAASFLKSSGKDANHTPKAAADRGGRKPRI